MASFRIPSDDEVLGRYQAKQLAELKVPYYRAQGATVGGIVGGLGGAALSAQHPHLLPFIDAADQMMIGGATGGLLGGTIGGKLAGTLGYVKERVRGLNLKSSSIQAPIEKAVDSINNPQVTQAVKTVNNVIPKVEIPRVGLTGNRTANAVALAGAGLLGGVGLTKVVEANQNSGFSYYSFPIATFKYTAS